MTRLQVIHIASIEALRSHAVRWDDLWQRSNVALPTLRAEMIALWMEHFAPEAAFQAIVVEDGGRWVAALPLVGRPAAGVLPAGWTVGNPWSTAADLLWDASRIGDVEMGEALVEAAGGLPWPLLWLEGIPLESPQWQAMRGALRRAGTPTACRFAWNTGRIELDGDWPAQQRTWSSDHRRKMHCRMRAPRRARRSDARLPRPAGAAGNLRAAARGDAGRRRRLEGRRRNVHPARAGRSAASSSVMPACWPSGTSWPWRSSVAAAGRSPFPTAWRPRASSIR